MNETLHQIKTEVFDTCAFEFSDFKTESESKEYHACQFVLNNLNIICRSSKTTPKKNGQFVTFWKRNKKRNPEPYEETDQFDFYVINATSENSIGQFVFPKSELIKKGIVSTERKNGKRGFRVYPIWDKTQSKQAKKTQQWQLNYFYEINSSTDFEKVKELYHRK